MRVWRFLRILGVNFLILLIGLIAIELAFGGWIGGRELDRLNISRNVALRYAVGHLYDGAGEIVYKRDAWGLRGEYGDPKDIAILTVGGSTTNQLYLSDEQTWQAALQARFAQDGIKMPIANAGIDGQSTIGHLAAFDQWFAHIPGLKPKWVLFYVGANDLLVDDAAGRDRLDYFATPHHEFRRKSALFRMGAMIAGVMKANTGRVTHARIDWNAVQWTVTPSRNDWETVDATRRDAYQDRLERLAAKARALGAEPVFITQIRADARQRNGQWEGVTEEKGLNGLDWAARLSLFNARTLAACEKIGALCLDLAQEIAFSSEDFYDYLHNTPKGAEKIGQYLYRHLRERASP